MDKRETKGKRIKRVVFFTAMEEEQHEALRYIAAREKRSMADVAREVLESLIAEKEKEYGIARQDMRLEIVSVETVEVRREKS